MFILSVILLTLYFIRDKNAPANKPVKVPTKQEMLKMQKTNKRMQNYILYFKSVQRDIKTLETSASVNVTEDLFLTKPYLEDFLTK